MSESKFRLVKRFFTWNLKSFKFISEKGEQQFNWHESHLITMIQSKKNEDATFSNRWKNLKNVSYIFTNLLYFSAICRRYSLRLGNFWLLNFLQAILSYRNGGSCSIFGSFLRTKSSKFHDFWSNLAVWISCFIIKPLIYFSIQTWRGNK